MTKFVEGFFKLGFTMVGAYLLLKHWVGATRIMKEGSISAVRVFTGLAEPAIAAKRVL